MVPLELATCGVHRVMKPDVPDEALYLDGRAKFAWYWPGTSDFHG